MQRVWIIRVSAVMLLWSQLLDGQHTADHRKVPQRVDPHRELGGTQGSWGAWGVWSSCSRTCGKGVQEQTRPCLPYTQHPSRGAGVQHQQLGGAFSATPDHHRTRTSNSSRGGEPLGVKQTAPGERRRVTLITPGKYGYGRAPYVAPLQKEPGRGSGTSHLYRQRRAPAANRGNSGFRPNNMQRLNRPYVQPRTQRPKHHQVWAPLYQPTSPNRAEVQQELYPGGRTAGHQQRERPYNPLPSSSCPGERAQYRICNSDACPPPSKPIRAVQCSYYNNQPFMGRLYQWEPFNEVPEEQHCELNCRAEGFRFYVRHSDRVIDGTPCGQNQTFLCVAGKCASLGCDEYLGSGKAVDRCGVCGGDNTTCRLVSGDYRHSLSKIGYHRIVEIPEGARKINVTEMMKSRNYLALRSRSGTSIINGNWAVDRPGKYEGGGTVFTYRRPNEISSTAGESFLAEGPTNEILDVYMIFQQPNPGVHYEYIIPSEKPVPPQHPDHRPEEKAGHDGHEQQENSTSGRNPPRRPDNQVPVVQPPRREREYNWKMTGATECSASCGKGFRYPTFHCVRRLNHIQVSDGLCDSSSRPAQQEEACNLQPCPAFWDIGEWSECSKTCGLGMQHRQVLCRQVYANRSLNVHASRCRHLERPETASTCQLKICSEWQVRSDWTACSAPCGLGQRSREVHCVSNVGDFVLDEECNMNLRPADVENCDMGPCAKSWFYTEWANKCSKTCEGGFRVREVRCLSDDTLSSEGCDEQLRPAAREDCSPEPCTPHVDENCRDQYFNCNVVVQARLCVYDYYKTTCCASCSRMAHKQTVRRGRS
ncbi:thrombospondin type-1 domain-containing protein 4 isoform X2 [Nothobranchius furzeri]|uniref:thrombospondin type-1 domain-containing protein 4 isoform X2 n=1 Tax=Nothobranchius furzeri TaxID=105023 RepID=UPI002403C6C1|nr:thrombospondin type-1 domain-containing protein 4 isoform X2 [Nothobranchius furzeri]